MLIVDKRCSDICSDELIAKVNEYKNSDMENFVSNQYGEGLAI